MAARLGLTVRGVRLFDKKFGADFVAALPHTPGVYVFRDDKGDALYVGKAVSLRRRLFSYRNASRRKGHRKMRVLVSRATSLEVQPLASEGEALLRENELILALRPPYNVDGAYSFLYPFIGCRSTPDGDLYCFTTHPSAYQSFDFRWHGAFRSRLRARQAFDALIEILALLAHIEPVSRLPPHPRKRGSRLVGFRQLHPEVRGHVETLLTAAEPATLTAIAEFLLEKPRARRDAGHVQECLRCLAAFCETDLRKLRNALDSAGLAGTFVDQRQRDALFITTMARAESTR